MDEEDMEYEQEAALREDMSIKHKISRGVTSLKTRITRKKTEGGWFGASKSEVEMTLDEFVIKVLDENIKDFSNIKLKGRRPNLTKYLEKWNEYFEMQQEDSPERNYIILNNGDFSGLKAQEMIFPKIYARGTNLNNVNFSKTIINGIVFDEETKIKGLKLNYAEINDFISDGTVWAKADVSYAVLDDMRFKCADLRGIIGLDTINPEQPRNVVYFKDSIVSSREIEILDNLKKRSSPPEIYSFFTAVKK